MENKIKLLPKELSSKIFYYVGNSHPFINELKQIILRLNDKKTHYDENNCIYSYESIINDTGYELKISYKDDFGNFEYIKRITISEILLITITNERLMILDDDFFEITLENILIKLNFDIFYIMIIE